MSRMKTETRRNRKTSHFPVPCDKRPQSSPSSSMNGQASQADQAENFKWYFVQCEYPRGNDQPHLRSLTDHQNSIDERQERETSNLDQSAR